MKHFLLSLSLLFLTACTVGPTYHPPAVEAPEAWKNPTEPLPENRPINYWWEVFRDDTLNQLEDQALSYNPTLFIACEKIEEAWGLAGVERANLFPQVHLAPSYQNTGQLFKIYLPRGDTGFADLLGLQSDYRIHQFSYALPAQMSYELDLWGKYRSLTRSAVAHAEGEQEAYCSALISLTSQVASAYFTLRELEAALVLYEKLLNVRKQEYALNQARFEKGLVNAIVLNSSFEDLTKTETDYYQALKERGVQENILATLTGVQASSFSIRPCPLAEDPPAVPAGLPCQALLRRPDIAEAERIMAATHHEINAAYASLLPSLELTGALGYLSPEFKNFLTWFSRLWTLGANADQILFDGGRTFGVIDTSWARFFQASGNYRQKVLTALQEVETALNNLEFENKQQVSLNNLAQTAEKNSSLANRRFEKGLVSSSETLSFERVLLEADILRLRLLNQRYQSTIALIKALGGSW